jgi:hypothetical protein
MWSYTLAFHVPSFSFNFSTISSWLASGLVSYTYKNDKDFKSSSSMYSGYTMLTVSIDYEASTLSVFSAL